MAPKSNSISKIDSAFRKPIKETYYISSGRFGERFMLSGHYGSLEVIWRSLTTNSILISASNESSQKTF